MRRELSQGLKSFGSGAEFDPRPQYAPGSQRFPVSNPQINLTHYQHLRRPFAGLERVAGESGFCGLSCAGPISACLARAVGPRGWPVSGNEALAFKK